MYLEERVGTSSGENTRIHGSGSAPNKLQQWDANGSRFQVSQNGWWYHTPKIAPEPGLGWYCEKWPN